jgi:hypothetical protein
LTLAGIDLRWEGMMETLSIKVLGAEKARLRALARERQTTLTGLMREALERLAREGDVSAPASCYELTRDLFEASDKLDASRDGDRSVNRTRMRSFGKSRS